MAWPRKVRVSAALQAFVRRALIDSGEREAEAEQGARREPEYALAIGTVRPGIPRVHEQSGG